MSDSHVLKHHKSFWKLTLRRFLSHILHEGLNLEVVICEVEFREIRSEQRKKNWFRIKIHTFQGEIHSVCLSQIFPFLINVETSPVEFAIPNQVSRAAKTFSSSSSSAFSSSDPSLSKRYGSE